MSPALLIMPETQEKVLLILAAHPKISCPICLSVFRKQDSLVQLKCFKTHIYHYRCILRIIVKEGIKSKCCLCKT